MTIKTAQVLIRLPSCYITGTLEQISNRKDIALKVDENGLNFEINHRLRIFYRTLTFRGYQFDTYDAQGFCVWWNFRYNGRNTGNYIEGVHQDWFIGFFTKSLNLRLCKSRDQIYSSSYRL